MGCGTSINENDGKNPNDTSKSQQQILMQINDNNQNTITQNKFLDLKQIKTEKSINPQQPNHNINIIPVKKQEQQIIQPKQSNARIYLFGQSKDERKVIQFQAHPTPHIQILLSRTHNPPPVKYQPTQVILEQSQELTSSNLYLSTSHPPYNYMYATFIKHNTIFLCGGVNFDFNNVSNQAFLYNIKQQPNASTMNTPIKNQKGVSGNSIKKNRRIGNNLMGSKFERLSFMKSRRYSQMGAYFKAGKLGYVYIFGGRNQNDQILDKCEKYSISQNKWNEIAPMSMPRSTGFSLIVNKKIYIFGGYNKQGKRSKKIERYNPAFDSWDVLNVKIHKGIQTGIILPCPASSEILIVGGNVQFGALKSVIKINFQNQTYSWDSDLKKQRLLQKGISLLQQNSAYVLGGDFEDTIQKYSYKDKTWKIVNNLTYGQCVSPDQINAFTLAQQTIQLNFQLNQNKSNLNGENQALLAGQYRYIFGSDDYPCVYELNTLKWVLKKKVVPMSLRLRSFMSAVKIKEGKIFIGGGTDCYYQKASRAAFIYYPGTNKAIQIPKMKQKKYGFSCCYFNNYVYIFGGQISKEGTVLNTAQKYNLVQQRWETLPQMPRQRTFSKAILSQNGKILLIGGTDCLYQGVPQIDIFDPNNDTFTQFDKAFPLACQIKYIDFTSKFQILKTKKANSDQFEFLDDQDFKNTSSEVKQDDEKIQKQVMKMQQPKQNNLNAQYQQIIERKLIAFGYNSYKKEDEAYLLSISLNNKQYVKYDEKSYKVFPYSLIFSVKENEQHKIVSNQQEKQKEKGEDKIKIRKQPTYYFISNKGVFKWQQSTKQMNTQIVINQIHLLQMPLQKFTIV